MAKIGLKNSNFVVDEDLTLEEAMRVITVNKKGAAIVLDKQNHMVGVVSDGDIRRAMIKGATMLTPIYKVMNSNVKTITLENKEILSKPQKFFDENRHIHLLPVVNKDNKLVDLLVLDYNPAK